MAELLQSFPNAKTEHFVDTSEATPRYNCIAFALGYTNKWWEPHAGYYWPRNAIWEYTVGAYTGLFLYLGYQVCASGDLEDGFSKIALYALNDRPTHAARQLPSGLWISKLGRDIDVQHTLRALEGPNYGAVHRFFRKRAAGGTAGER